ncbi:MAG: coproporphyrinogen dehydrogenase HemZ [Clostridia bacterium]|nr:coproporphyrinogen dehydrogenase HemZ [Clostridia bacterium]
MKLKLDYSNLPSYMNDVPEVMRAFSPHIVIDNDAEDLVKLNVVEKEGEVYVEIISDKFDNSNGSFYIDAKFASLEYKRIAKREVKRLLYAYCNKLSGIDLPYGCLTGVRPTKLYYDLIGSHSNIKQYFIDNFSVEPKRAELIENVVLNQSGIYSIEDGEVDIFVNIPICPTRCRYCSFISTEIGRVKKLVPSYVEAVLEEVIALKCRIADEGLKVRSIYVGGGTPTSLTADQLKTIIEPLSEYNVEFTVEAGRPDSITEDKLKALADCCVTRISINPQTFKDQTLDILGRGHNTAQLYDAYELARKFKFDINMDLIAGLPGETFLDFKDSLSRAVALNPENITVHTLSLKRGSTLTVEGAQKTMDGTIKEMTDFSIDYLTQNEYVPYYMYRQKNMADGLENVGWCKKGKQCIYNIDYMEETTTVLSAGAGAMSKFVYHKDGRIERDCNAKGFEEYLRRKGKLI